MKPPSAFRPFQKSSMYRAGIGWGGGIVIVVLSWTSFGASLSPCTCKSSFMVDVVRRFDWEKITYVMENDDCLPGPHLLKHISSMEKSLLVVEVPINTTSILQALSSHTNFFVKYSNFTKSLLLEANSLGFLNTQSWCIFTESSEQLQEIVEIKPSLDIFIDSNVLVVQMSGCVAKVESLYRIGPKSKTFIVQKGGDWRTGGFQQPLLYEDNLAKRGDFQGYPMMGVGVRVFPHFTAYEKNGNITGFVGDLINILKASHNFTLRYKVLDGYAYGKVIGDPQMNRWNGMVGELQNRKVDFTISELSVTQERSKILSYTQPLYMISRKMYVATREDIRRKLLTYTSPMDSNLYMSTCLCLLALALSIVTSSYVIRVLTNGKAYEDINFLVALWYMLSALLQQGSPSYPRNISTRMMYWYGCMLSVVVYASYSATLVSHLTVVLPTTIPFSDFYGLVKQTGWDAGNVKDDLFEVTASQTCAAEPRKDECNILYEVWTKNILRSPGNLVSTYNEGLQRSIDRKYAFIGVDVTTNNYIKTLPQADACLIKELPTQYITGGIAIGMQLNSPFLTSFESSLQKLKEMGVMDKLIRKWLKVDVTCEVAASSPADLIDTASLFILLLIGLFFSLIFFAAEGIIKQTTKSSQFRRE